MRIYSQPKSYRKRRIDTTLNLLLALSLGFIIAGLACNYGYRAARKDYSARPCFQTNP